MLNAWWAMLHISPPVYFQVMSLCLPTSREFFSLYKVGTFWISTGTVLVRTLYDTFTVKITPLAFTCVVYLVFFSGSVAYLRTRRRATVFWLYLCTDRSGLKRGRISLCFSWSCECQNPQTNSKTNDCDGSSNRSPLTIKRPPCTVTLLRTICGNVMTDKTLQSVRYTGVCLPETCIGNSRSKGVWLLTGVWFIVPLSSNECRTLQLAVLMIQFNKTTVLCAGKCEEYGP